VNLLLTSSSVPEFDEAALNLWNKFCIAELMPGNEVVPYLMFAPAAAAASIDAIVFLQPNSDIDLEYALGMPRPSTMVDPWEISQKIRDLPENCAMRDGRKWKRIPQIVLTDHGQRVAAFDGLDVEFVVDVTERMLHGGYATPFTWQRIEKIINQYHEKSMSEYERVGLLIISDHGRYRVRRAYLKKNANESEYYYGGKDKRRFRGFVTIGRDSEGVAYEAQLFEALLNDRETGEHEVHRFLEQHPHFLAESMMGVPISHKLSFPSKKQIPDFAISPILPRDANNWVKLLELKGPEASILQSGRKRYRGLASKVIEAMAQVSDYTESLHEPLNLKSVEKALGYIPETSEKAVLIGRAPTGSDAQLWDKRREEQSFVKIVTYDELLQEQRARHSWRKIRF
jgi:hypothetical protein